MKDVVLNEVMKELSWRERIVVKIFPKTFYKLYKEGVMKGFNWSNKMFVKRCCPVEAPVETNE